MSDTESERLALEQDVEDHAARQQTMPMPRQPPMPILPLSQAAVPEPAMAEASVPSARPPLTSRDLRAALATLLPSKDLSTTTLKLIREDLEDHFGMSRTSLESRKDEIDNLVKDLVSAPAEPHPRVPEGPPTKRLRTKTCVLPVLAQVGDPDPSEEDSSARRRVYLITFPHPRTAHAQDGLPLLAPENFSRRDVLEALLDACRSDLEAISAYRFFS